MNENLLAVFQAFEYEVSRREDWLQFDNIEELKRICYNTTGHKEHFVWHLYFNLDKFKGNKTIFNPNDIRNINSILYFADIMELTFEKLHKMTGVSSLDLKVIFNNFLIDKENQSKKEL